MSPASGWQQEDGNLPALNNVVATGLTLQRRDVWGKTNMTLEEIREYLHRCRFCDSYTGDDTTGCSGAPCPCRHFNLDSITAPKGAEKYRWLFDPTVEPPEPEDDKWWEDDNDNDNDNDPEKKPLPIPDDDWDW